MPFRSLDPLIIEFIHENILNFWKLCQ